MIMDRRHFLMASAAAGACIGFDVHAQSRPVINLQLGWIPSGNQIGEVCAKHLGYYEAEGIELRFQGGGPNIDATAQLGEQFEQLIRRVVLCAVDTAVDREELDAAIGERREVATITRDRWRFATLGRWLFAAAA